jgi:hypothetical protein
VQRKEKKAEEQNDFTFLFVLKKNLSTFAEQNL